MSVREREREREKKGREKERERDCIHSLSALLQIAE